MLPDVSYATAPVPAALAPFVRSLVGVRLTGGVATRQLELPVAGTAVIVELSSARWHIGAGVEAPLRAFGSFAGGLSLTPAVSVHGGAYELIQFDLTPAGTLAVLGVPGAELAEAVVALEDLLGPEAARLAERLAAGASWERRFATMERWLLARVGEPVLSPDLAWALGRLEATGGRVAIGTLQAELGCSRRHLASRFAEAVGTTPKRYGQLVRFVGAAAQLRAGAAPAQVAASCGYADQAHLTRHVRRFGATTPALLRGAAPEVRPAEAR